MSMSMGSVAWMSSSSSTTSWMAGRGSRCRGGGVRCGVITARLTDQYQTLRIQPGASEKEVKKAFRRLALQYHPDVCKGRDCGAQFQLINEAYDILINNLRAGEGEQQEQWQQAQEWGVEGGYDDEGCWDMWEEWMGWEGAGTLDYTSHINPYI